MSAGETSDSAGAQAPVPVSTPGAGEPAAGREGVRGAPKPKRPRPTFEDGSLTRVFKFPSKSYPRTSHYVTADELIIRIKKGRKRWKLVIPKKRVRAFRTNQWFAKKRWIEIELTFTQAVRLGLAEKRAVPEPAGGAAIDEAAVEPDAVGPIELVPAAPEPARSDVSDGAGGDWLAPAAQDASPVHMDADGAALDDAGPDAADDGEGDDADQFVLSDVTDSETDDGSFSDGVPEADSDEPSEAVNDEAVPDEPVVEAGCSATAVADVAETGPEHAPAPEAVPETALRLETVEPITAATAPAIPIIPPAAERGNTRLQRWWPGVGVALAASVLGLVTAAGLNTATGDLPEPVIAQSAPCDPQAVACSAAITTGSIETTAAVEPAPPPADADVGVPTHLEPAPVEIETAPADRIDADAAPIGSPPSAEQLLPAAAAEPVAVPAAMVGCRDLPDVARAISIRFETASIELDAPARAALDDLAGRLRSCAGARVVVEGHTDSVGRADRNEILSHRRAEVVRNHLIEAGVAPQRVWAIGLGQTRPYEPNVTPEQKRRNRRAAVVIDGAW